MGCCVYEVQPQDISLSRIPIGRPIANIQIYLLDPSLQLVPIGEVGEIYIGGVGVAKGYLNLVDLNKQKFITNPFILESDTPIYKTGDFGRYFANGNL